MLVKAPRGTYDILPDDSRKWQHIEGIIRDTAEKFGYREIRTPVFEHTELFQRGVGESTDIVSKEMYTFVDRSKDKRSLTLRPEGTASCTRCLIEHNLFAGTLPVKWYYHGPMFRYGRPQAGRFRQFHQFGVEAYGSGSPFMDAEVIILLAEILNKLGLTGYEIHLNSIGCPQCREGYRQKLIDHITPVKIRLCQDCQIRYLQNPLRVLDCKEEECQRAIEGFPVIAENLCANCRTHYSLVQDLLTANKVSYIRDDKLVRGLDYYTNTAFEIHLPGIGAQSAVGGGGRYNGLVKECGGPDLPGIGFALGLERLLMAMEAAGTMSLSEDSIQAFVAVMDNEYADQAFALLHDLRRAGIKAEQDYSGRSGKAQMKYADKLRAQYVVLIGAEEINAGFYTVRDMQTKEQIRVERSSIVESMNRLLGNR